MEVKGVEITVKAPERGRYLLTDGVLGGLMCIYAIKQ